MILVALDAGAGTVAAIAIGTWCVNTAVLVWSALAWRRYTRELRAHRLELERHRQEVAFPPEEDDVYP